MENTLITCIMVIHILLLVVHAQIHLLIYFQKGLMLLGFEFLNFLVLQMLS